MNKLSNSDLEILRRLRGLLNQAKAPVSHRQVASIIEFDDGSLSEGFNVEKSIDDIIHAEDMALAAQLNSVKPIKTIHLMGSGIPMDIKNALPCERCSSLLAKRMTPNTGVTLYFNDASGKVQLNLSSIVASYNPFETDLFLRDLNGTLLTDTDKKLVSYIIKSLQSFSSTAELYLTGSSSGRGGPKSQLAKEITGVPYWDIDLLALFSTEKADVINKWFSETYSAGIASMGGRFSNAKIRDKSVPSYILELGQQDSSDFIYRRIYWAEGMDIEIQPPLYSKNSGEPSTIDLSVGRSLESTITPNYLRRKWYSRLV